MFFRQRRGADPRRDSRPDQFGQPVAISGYARSHVPQFYEEVERRVEHARQVRFISMGLQILHEGKILDILVERVLRGVTEVTACMGSPHSPGVVDRLIEEETSDVRPQAGRSGIESNIRALLDHLDKFNNPAGFRVLLFEHYPTFATYIVDQDVFLVPYMYQTLGWQAPVLHVKDDGRSEIARFFTRNAERVLRDAVPARDIFDVHPERRHMSDQWIQACVAVVPDAGEPLHLFGSGVVGFDLRSGTRTPAIDELPELAPTIGDAAERGFHAPLVDPLFFPNEAAIRRVAAELTILSGELPRFSLVHPRIEDRSQSRGDIAIRCDDPSGVAEALHSELVSRVYRRAVTSAYQAGRGLTRRMSGPVAGRDDLMVRRYGSPNVLNRFEVHFPLCCEPPVDPVARRALVERLDRTLRDRVPAEPVIIDRIHLLVRRPADAHWQILKVYRLN
jgi:hypothetical protein